MRGNEKGPHGLGRLEDSGLVRVVVSEATSSGEPVSQPW